MRELSELAAETVVFRVVAGALDYVAPADFGGAVLRVGFVGCEVDFAQELLLVVFEFADHLFSIV